MAHPLEDIINNADGFLLIGDSSRDRFPGDSYNVYTTMGKRFYCLDMGGLSESRGKTKGGKVYSSVEELPEQRDDLAIIWVKPRQAKEAVELAHSAGCKRVWFSFGSGHHEAVARARELDMQVVEIGRCPVYYLEDTPRNCKFHTLITKTSGTWGRPPQLDAKAKRRETW